VASLCAVFVAALGDVASPAGAGIVSGMLWLPVMGVAGVRLPWALLAGLVAGGSAMLPFRGGLAESMCALLLMATVAMRLASRGRDSAVTVVLGANVVLLAAAAGTAGSSAGAIFWSLVWLCAALRALERAALARHREGHRGTPRALPLRSRALVQALPMLLVVVPLVFVAFPRSESATGGRGRPAGTSGRSGLGTAVPLHGMARIQQDEGTALRIRGGTLALQPNLHLRAGTLDLFDGYQWTRTSFMPLEGEVPLLIDPTAERLAAAHNSLLTRPERVSLAFVDVPAELVPTLPGTVGVSLLGGARPWVLPDGSLRTARRGQEAVLHVDPSRPDHFRGGPVEAMHTWLPGGMPLRSLRRLAVDSGAAGLTDPAAIARALEGYLQRTGRYTTDLSHLGDGPAALEAFVASGYLGHCELFATAMALTLRDCGIPSRLAVGYNGGQFGVDAAGTPELTVRHRDAHSWVEAWIPGEGWATFDPTPAVPEQSAEPPSTIAAAMPKVLMDFMQRYDARRQQALFAGLAGRAARVAPEVPGGAYRRALARLGETWREPAVLGAAAGLFLLNIGAALALRSGRRRGAPVLRAWLAARTGGDASALLPALAAILGAEPPEHGAPLRWEDLAARLAGCPRESVADLRTAYETARYGPPHGRRAATGRALRLARQLAPR
jgi:transglutaminase-like putative cysteine protease